MKIALICLFIFILICLLIVVLDSNRFVVRTYELDTDKLAEDVTFVFVSDLHNKQYGKENQKLLSKIEELNPQFVLCGGDIPTAKPGADLSVAISFMQKLCEKYTVYYANGNHEYRMRIYPEKYIGMHEEYEAKTQNERNIKLQNKSASPTEGMRVHGLELERRFYRRFKKVRPTKEHILELLDEELGGGEMYHILLAHNPDYFDEYAECGPDLVLSGHVHGGVGRLPLLGGAISPSLRLFPKYDGGLFTRGQSTMIVSRGLGMHTIPLRFCNPAELVLVKIHAKDKNTP